MDKKKSFPSNTGLGTGYVSIIMVFVMICLTALAALSYSAASRSDAISEKSKNTVNEYYNAERAANRVLMQIDGIAAEAAGTRSFASFPDKAGAVEGVTVSPSDEGYTAVWYVGVTQKLALRCEATVYSEPSSHDGKRYEIKEWKTVPAQDAAEAHIIAWTEPVR